MRNMTMDEDIIFESGSALAKKIIDILSTRDCNEHFMARLADIPAGLSEEETEKWLIDNYGERRLKDLEFYTEDSDLPLFGAPRSETKICMERYYYSDDDAVQALSRAFPEETILLRYYDNDSVCPFRFTYTAKAGNLEFTGFHDDVGYKIWKAPHKFRELYGSMSEEYREDCLYIQGPHGNIRGTTSTIEDLNFRMQDGLNRYPEDGIIIFTVQEDSIRDDSGDWLPNTIRRKYYMESSGEIFQLDPGTAELTPVEKDDLFPELPEKKQNSLMGWNFDDNENNTGKRSVYKEWHLQKFYAPLTLSIIVPDCDPVLKKELQEKFHEDSFRESDYFDFDHRETMYGREADEEKVEDYLIEKSREYPEAEIWLSVTHGSDLPVVSHIRKGRLFEIVNARTQVDLEVPSEDPLARYLEKVFADESYLQQKFGCTGTTKDTMHDCDHQEENGTGFTRFRFSCPASLSIGLQLDNNFLPENESIRIRTSFSNGVSLYTFSNEKRERTLSLDVGFYPAAHDFPESYRKKLAEGFSPDSRNFMEDLANDDAFMPVSDGEADTVSELLRKVDDVRKRNSDWTSMLLDITRKRDGARKERHAYLFTPDHAAWFLMDKYSGELSEIDIRKYLKSI